MEQAHDEMKNRHLKEALALQRKALEKFETIDPQKLSNSEMIRFLTAGANLERLTRKLSTPTQQGVSEDFLAKVEEFFKGE